MVQCNSTRQDPAVDFAPGAPKLDEKAADALQLIRSKLDRIVFTLYEIRDASTCTMVRCKASEADEANNFNESVTSLPKTLIASFSGNGSA